MKAFTSTQARKRLHRDVAFTYQKVLRKRFHENVIILYTLTKVNSKIELWVIMCFKHKSLFF